MALLVIFTGARFMESWADAPLSGHYLIDTTPNGFITDETFYGWLTTAFKPLSKKRQQGAKRLLLLDGHTTHVTMEAVQFCNEKEIILFLTPPYLTHLTQPLDVGVFGPWKDYYIEAVDTSFRTGCTDFDKVELLSILDSIRKKTLKESTIKHAWANAGLNPYNPSLVIEKLRERVAPLTPPAPESPQGPMATPYTANGLRELTEHIYDLSGNEEFSKALDKLTRGAAAIATANKLLQKSLNETRAAHQRRQELKRAAKRFIPTAGVVRLVKARQMIRTKQEKREKEANKRLENQLQRDMQKQARKAENEERRRAKQLVRFERIMEQSRKQIARGFALNEKEGKMELQNA